LLKKGDSIQVPKKDQIIITKKLHLEEVIETINGEGISHVREPPVKLEKVTKVARCWYEAKISDSVIRKIILQHHPRCKLAFFPRVITHLYNDAELVPKSGATVEETIKKLKKYEKKFIHKRSKCIQHIKHLNGKNFGHVILTQIPIKSLHRHKTIEWNFNGLIHFEGSHRLLSLYYPKKIHFDYIDCFLASTDKNLMSFLKNPQ